MQEENNDFDGQEMNWEKCIIAWWICMTETGDSLQSTYNAVIAHAGDGDDDYPDWINSSSYFWLKSINIDNIQVMCVL